MRTTAPAAILLLAAAGAAAAPSPPPRPDLAALEHAIDEAVSRVSPPSAFFPPGLGARCRGYRVPGVGLVFVLAPRVLPGPPRPAAEAAADHLERARQALGPEPGADPVRARMEHVLAEMRRSATAESPPRPAPADAARRAREMAELQREMEAFEREAEQAQREAFDGLMRALRASGAMAVAEAGPEPSPPPSRPAPETAAVRPESAAPRLPGPPWRGWIPEAHPPGPARRAPEQAVAEVRAALLRALPEAAAGLGAHESVVVTVDFVEPSLLPPDQPRRTLVLRARRADLAERAAGRIGEAELARRALVTEY